MENPQAYGLAVLSAGDLANGVNLPAYQRTDSQQRLVSARELHEWLGIKKDFSDWIKQKIGSHRLRSNTDYVMLTPAKSLLPLVGGAKSKKRGGHNRTEYAITPEVADIITLGTNNEKGDALKRYLLSIEKMTLVLPGPVAQRGKGFLPGLEEHLQPVFQRKQSQKAQAQLRAAGGANAVIRHGADTCRAQTGMSSREVIQLGQGLGLPYRKRINAREVLRHIAPAVACAVSLVDTAVMFGADRDKANILAANHQDLFAGLIELGLAPAESFPGSRFSPAVTIYR